MPFGQKEHIAADIALDVDVNFPVGHERQRTPKIPSPFPRYFPEGPVYFCGFFYLKSERRTERSNTVSANKIM